MATKRDSEKRSRLSAPSDASTQGMPLATPAEQDENLLYLQTEGTSVYPVGLHPDGKPFSAKRQRPLDAEEDQALTRAFELIRHLSAREEMILRADTTVEQRREAILFIERCWRGIASMKDKTAAWLQVAVALEGVPEHSRTGDPLLPATLRTLIGAGAEKLDDDALRALVNAWHVPGEAKWGSFVQACMSMGIMEEKKDSETLRRMWSKHKTALRGEPDSAESGGSESRRRGADSAESGATSRGEDGKDGA